MLYYDLLPVLDCDQAPLLMVYHAVFDESGKADREYVVFAGFIAAPGPWRQLSKGWKEALEPFGLSYWRTVDAVHMNGQFKQFRQREEKLRELVLGLSRLICEHVASGSMCTITMDQYRTLADAARKKLKDPFYAAFHAGLVNLAGNFHFQPGDWLTLVCDDSEEYSSECLKAYRRLRSSHEAIAERIAGICFHDDKLYVPLQAADLLAGCRRMQAEGKLRGVWQEMMGLLDSAFSIQNKRDVFAG